MPSTLTVWLPVISNVAGSCADGRVGESPHAAANTIAIRPHSAAPRVIVVIQSSVLQGAGMAPRAHVDRVGHAARRASSRVWFVREDSKARSSANLRHWPWCAMTVHVAEDEELLPAKDTA